MPEHLFPKPDEVRIIEEEEWFTETTPERSLLQRMISRVRASRFARYSPTGEVDRPIGKGMEN